MKKILTVKVTRDDIRRGIPSSCSLCPIARALRRLTRKKIIYVDIDEAAYGGVLYKLPKVAQRFIRNFDSGDKVKPFAFNLKAVED